MLRRLLSDSCSFKSCRIGRWLTLAATLLFVGAVARPADAQAEKPEAAKVPVKKVVLFSSGVGYFQHEGSVTGNASVDLKFPVEDVNDLLKSMVLEDLGGGQISTVSYGSRDPITKTLRTFAIDLTTNPTLGQLLSQVRGEKVEINAPSAITGTIVGVETQKQVRSTPGGGEETIDVELLTLLTDEGLRRIPLDSVGRIKLVNKDLDAEFRQALTVLATAHSTDKKTVTLNFLGQGERKVRVGYIQESPVWKTSYRLVLDEKEKPFLQGWAIVENTSDEDWTDVNLSLVSGRPISFVMDLYSPLYASRPLEQMEMYASLRPQVYGQDLADSRRLFEAADEKAKAAVAMSAPTAGPVANNGSLARAGGRGRGGARGGGGGLGGGGFGGNGLVSDAYAGELQQGQEQLGLQDSMFFERRALAAAQGGDVGELFKYDIKNPVTLARQRSAMLPIINEAVEGEKLSIYNPGVQPKHPLNGVRLKNSSKLHLMQGPMTVFDGGVYAGDAKIPDLPPGSERLLSYALDLDVEVAPTSDNRPQQLVSAKLIKGILQTEYKLARAEVRNQKFGPQPEDRAHRIPDRHKLDTARAKEPTEKTRDLYRFAVKAEPGKAADLAISEERTQRQNIAVNNLNDNAIQMFLSEKVISESVKDALREVIRRKAEIADLNMRKGQVTQEIATIDQEQARIRQNMQALDHNTDLYNLYIKKFTDQESQVERLRGQAKELDQQIATAQKSLDEFLMKLELS